MGGETALHAQPDYFLVCKGEKYNLKGVRFQFPWFLHFDHHAIGADIQVGRQGRLKKYRHMHQTFPLILPTGLQDKDITTFSTLTAKCGEPITKQAPR